MGYNKQKDGDGGTQDEVDIVSSEIYYLIHPTGDQFDKKANKEKLHDFYESPNMPLLEFVEHEIVFEYEKAKD